MKHAGPQTLAALEAMLRVLRAQGTLVERTPGSFYRKSKAFLHFHEDPAGIFADIKIDGDKFTRLPVSTQDEQARLLKVVDRALR
jgi:hypothetical protein